MSQLPLTRFERVMDRDHRADNAHSWQGKYNMDANRIANHDGTISEKGKAYLSM